MRYRKKEQFASEGYFCKKNIKSHFRFSISRLHFAGEEKKKMALGEKPVFITVNSKLQLDPQLEKAQTEMLFPKKIMLILSKCQIIFGAVAAVLQVILYGLNDWGIALTGMGLWSGFCFCIAGGIGLVAAYAGTRKSVKNLMILSIVAAICALALTTMAVPGIQQSLWDRKPGLVSLFLVKSKVCLFSAF